jgi:hypothetical protein
MIIFAKFLLLEKAKRCEYIIMATGLHAVPDAIVGMIVSSSDLSSLPGAILVWVKRALTQMMLQAI